MEFWHNRLCLGENQNMDSYERLIAVKFGYDIDAAIGQVSSSRLRTLPDKPPPIWQANYKTTSFDSPFTYRRTVAFVKNPIQARDYIVLKDQHWGEEPVLSTWIATFEQETNQYTKKIDANTYDMGNSTLYCFPTGITNPTWKFDRWDWKSEGNENATRVRILGEKASSSEWITVLYPAGSLTEGASVPKISVTNGTVHIAFEKETDYIVFNEPSDSNTPVVTLKRGKKSVDILKSGDIDLNRSQGDIGLNVMNAGYGFGEIPLWMKKQRMTEKSYNWPPNPFFS